MGGEISKDKIPQNEPNVTLVNKSITEIPSEFGYNSTVFKLNLAHNSITSLPPDLKKLEVLILSNNHLKEIGPSLITSLLTYGSLDKIDLSYNEITKGVECLKDLINLKKINLYSNFLSDVDLHEFRLESIDIGANNLTKIPKLPMTCTSLNVDNNQISDLSLAEPEKNVFKNLFKFCASYNNITSIDPNIYFSNLQVMDISKNQITNLPDLGTVAPKLKLCNVSSNQIVKIPKLPRSLVELYARNNKIEKVSSSITSCNFLLVCDLAQNNIKKLPQLPPTIQTLYLFNNEIDTVAPTNIPDLIRLFMFNNKLKEIPPIVGNSLAEYYLSGNEIESFSAQQFGKSVTRIDLRKNKISKIPSEIFSISTLTHLFLGNNQIARIPNEIVSSEIILLDLKSNPIRAFPDKMPETLEQLFISNCKLKKIPSCLTDLPDFIELHAANNRISSLPLIKSLKTIHLSKNAFKSLPELPPSTVFADFSFNTVAKIEPFEHQSLQELDLSYNKVSNFPECNTPRLRYLKLNSNPISTSISISKYPNLRYLDISSTHSFFDEIPEELALLSTSEPGLSNDPSQRFITRLSSSVGFASKRGLRQTQEDAICIRQDFVKGVDIFGLFDGRDGSRASKITAYKLQHVFYGISEFNTKNIDSAFDTVLSKLKKQRIAKPPPFAVIVKSKDQIIAKSGYGVSIFVIGSNVRRIGERYSIYNSLSRTHGPLPLIYGRLDAAFSEQSPPKSQIVNLEEGDKYLIMVSESVPDLISEAEMLTIVSLSKSAGEVAVRLKNATYGNMSADSITAIAIQI